MTLNRRDFNKLLGATGLAASAGIAAPVYAQTRPKVVIIGGGAGGATVATHLRKSAPNVDITLVERNALYTTCFFSNLYLGGVRSIESITHSYDGLRARGISIVNDIAIDVDATKKVVTLISGNRLAYDRLVLSPGIDLKYDAIEGYSREVARSMPHSWRAGQQTRTLKSQLEAMPAGGVVVMSAPPNPYRCPPGPYERACMIAHYLKANKPGSKLIILDPKKSFSKRKVFEEAFKKYYSGIIEHHLTTDIDDFRVVSVDPSTKTLTTKGGVKVKADVANIIPPQTAGGIVHRAGCATKDWCPVNPDNFQSKLVKDIYVLGDSSIATQMPKSGFSANSQGKVVANDLAAALAGVQRYPTRTRNTCWSLLSPNDSVKVGASYAIGVQKGRKKLVAYNKFVSSPGEDAVERRVNYEESIGWYSGMTSDMFARG